MYHDTAYRYMADVTFSRSGGKREEKRRGERAQGMINKWEMRIVLGQTGLSTFPIFVGERRVLPLRFLCVVFFSHRYYYYPYLRFFFSLYEAALLPRYLYQSISFSTPLYSRTVTLHLV